MKTIFLEYKNKERNLILVDDSIKDNILHEEVKTSDNINLNDEHRKVEPNKSIKKKVSISNIIYKSLSKGIYCRESIKT